ncbi:DNA ligase, ATP-dependent, central [uncultured Caudovirales phage]|uniref:DNA ligase n=1 Tax=uncultured Caudovirales phage TaxID=2100421 RepID=A0A6J5LKY8_9CAUD|nr:DNA ligase, ATP-dependent, central [uncultured Caudovirales phage]CAB4135194.1 DNA ligase, ATP-dependent, central [uncultured Caudovirales phage]
MKEFRQRQGHGQERYWIIDVKKNKVTTIWGALNAEGTRVQHGTVTDAIEPKGKVNTKAFMSAEDNAQFTYDRAIRKKTEEGYVEVGIGGKALMGESASEIDHCLALPKNLAFSKPNNTISDKAMNKLDKDGRLLYTRKVNGMCVIAHIMENGDVELYSRRMDSITGKFPHLATALQELEIPTSSVLLFEAYMGNGNTKRDMKLLQTIMNADDDKALARQKEIGCVKFYLFRVPILGGKCLEAMYSNEANLYLIAEEFTDTFFNYPGKFLSCAAPRTFLSTEAAKAYAVDRGWEGWVVYDKDAIIGDKSYRFTGKPDRPASCFKLKPSQEDDFIAYFSPIEGTKERPMGFFGSGKNRGRVGTLSLYQLNDAGEEVYISEVGSGLTDLDRQVMMTSKWPQCVQIEYEERFYIKAGDDTNALQLPRYKGLRQDKSVDECINSEL